MSQDGVRASGIFDLIKIGFVPLQRAHNIKYLASGAAADIWKVQSLESHNNFPSLYVSKVLRISPSGFKDIPTYVGSANQRSPADSPQVAGNERFSWEAFVNMYTHKVSQWALLRHENIIRVYSNTQSLNLHVDFCLNGTVRDALQTPGGRMMNKWDIISETLAGLKYLHDQNPPIIHGNINAGKLFFDSNYKTKLGEFGLAALCYQISPFVPSISFDGFSRWMSKELLAVDPTTKSSLSPTTQSDIWALACTILEILTEKLPFARYNLDFQIMTAILNGELPGFRDELPSGHNFYMVWEVLEGCWSGDPLLRPDINSVISRFQATGFLKHRPLDLYAPTGILLGPPSELSWPPSSSNSDRQLWALQSSSSNIGMLESGSPSVSSQPPGSKRPRAILDNLLHPGEWRNKRARSGSRSGSPSASGVSTPGDIYSHSPAQSNLSSKSLSPMGRPGPSAPSHSSPNTTPHVPAPPPNETQTASLPVTDITASTQSSTAVGWAGLEQALQALRVSAKICPPLSSAVGDLASCLPLFEAAARNRTDYDELATGLKSMVDLLIRYLNGTSSEEFRDTIPGIAEIIRREIESINMHQSRNLPRRMLGASSTEDDLIRRYRRIEQLFRQLQGEASPRTFSATNERRFNRPLENLRPTNLARFNSELSTEVSRRGCTKDTRTKILEDSIAWSEDPDLAKIYWMNGMAGTGKTTIAYSFCERLEIGKQLAASFFCTRASPECRDAKRIIPTIAYQLAQRFTPFRYSLCQQLNKDPDISTSQLSDQFDLLLKKPLLAAKDKLSNNLVIVVDALDECSDPHIVELFLDLLFRSVGELPVKFFVTSRPEPAIRNKMMPESERARSILYLHEIEQSLVQADIELYLREELASIAPEDDDITELAERAGNLFIYAATAVRYVRPAGKVVDSKARLKAILAISAESKNKLPAIDALYTAILTAAVHDQELEPEEQDRMRLVLWTAICACEPILIHTLSILSGLDNKNATMVALESLRSVLHVSEHNELVTTLHTSFPDYMLTPERSGAFYCDKVTHSQLLAEQCFRVMNTQLRFNICSIQSSFVPDDEIPELGERINTRISKELFYACRFWVDHLSETKSRALFLLANDFLSQQLLFWMEVMNLKRCMTLGVTSISKLNAWLTQVHVDTDTDLLALASDARRFVTRYASSPIASYTPHIYLSALPLSPSSSSMRSRYLPRFKGLIKVSGAILDKLEKAAPSTWELTSLIRSVAFSPGGDCVVLGDDQGRISVQNAYDGKCLVQPFKAHKKVVTSLGVSSDGMQIVSGSHDMTLSVWNIHDGSLITGPYKGHTNRVTSVAFSPDVAHIVSGSDDCTVRIWGPQVVTISMISLTGHAQEVKSVAFSPDGSRVVSGSVDHTIRLWDLSSGATILILDGHTASVSAVQYSPDGAYIISGSHDSNILIWNASNGSLTRRLQKAHSKPITAIAISPSGDHIVSGSLDCTVRVWNLHNGKLTAGPFEGHTESVRSVGFLSDGMRIVSASDDKTVRVWNAQDQIPQSAWTSNERGSSLHDHFAYSPTKTHVAFFTLYKTTFLVWDLRTMTVISVPTNGGVRHLRFSPDGTHIHSIHNEGTLCTWIVQTGELLEGPHRCSSSDRFITSECSADGTRVVTLGMNMMVELWHVKANRNPILCATSVSCSPIFSQVGDRFITYAYDPVNPSNSYVNVWDADTGRHVAGPFSTERVHDFSPDGAYICCKQQHDQSLQLLNVNNGEIITLPQSEYHHQIIAKFTPDGLNVVATDCDTTCRIWNIRDQTHITIPVEKAMAVEITELIGHSPDGWLLLAGYLRHDKLRNSLHIWRFRVDNPPFTLNSDGWALDYQRQPLLWVPKEIRQLFPMCNEVVLSDQVLQSVDYDGMLVGDEWSQCYLNDVRPM